MDYKYYIYIGIVIVIMIAVSVIASKKQKKQERKFLDEHPNAVRIYLTLKALITVEAVSVASVNGEVPVLFTEKGKTGFYVVPGENKVLVSYTYSRPGVVYKNVTRTYGPTEKIIEIEEGKSYRLSFDRKEEDFVIEEL